jgi:hypothetical protein
VILRYLKMMRGWLPRVSALNAWPLALLVAGLGLVTVGIGMVSLPAALVVLGCVVSALALTEAF